MGTGLRIQFSHSSGGGPGVFMKRLKEYLTKHHNIQVVDKNPHLYVSAVWRGNPPKGVKTIHRVDNCYFDTLRNNMKAYNASIRKAVQKADGVIYQSKFSLGLCKHILGIKGSCRTIIHNGFDQSICNEVVPFEHPYKYLFVTCAIWRPIKRPKSIIRAFQKADIPESALIMIGKGIKAPSDPRIICTGSIKLRDIYKYYKAANAIIHVSRLDACPNTVVEALSFGKPVVCNNAGGTPEIVANDGIIATIDPPDSYKTFAMHNADAINVDVLSDAIREVIKRDWHISRPDLNMDICAQQYMDFFAQVLG